MRHGIFYPGTGGVEENTTEDQEEVYPGGILNVPLGLGHASAATWRKEFTEQVFPRLCEFQPDILFLSAGFDAHEEDHIHSQGDIGVTEFDYAWLTENLQKIANQFAEGRIVSVLEGGYNIKLGTSSPLAQSVAAHVRALLNTHNGPLWRPQQAGQISQFIDN